MEYGFDEHQFGPTSNNLSFIYNAKVMLYVTQNNPAIRASNLGKYLLTFVKLKCKCSMIMCLAQNMYIIYT